MTNLTCERRALLAIALAAVLSASEAAYAHGYHRGWGGHAYGPRVGVYIGAPWFWGPSWYWGGPWYGYPYGYRYAYGYPYGYGYGYPFAYAHPYASAPYPPAVRYVSPPADAVEQSTQGAAPGAWYYCSDPPGYYPHVSTCSRPWLEVAPFSTQGSAVRN